MLRSLVLALALAVAGCGGDEAVSKAEYEERTRAIQVDLAAAMQVPLDTQAQRHDAAPRVAGAMRDAADESDDIEPPDGIAEPHDAYVAALRRCADRFEEILGKQDDKDEAFAELLALDCVAEMQEAIGQIADKGYRIEDPVG